MPGTHAVLRECLLSEQTQIGEIIRGWEVSLVLTSRFSLVIDYIPCLSLSQVLIVRQVWVSPAAGVVLLHFLKDSPARHCIALTRDVHIRAVIIPTINLKLRFWNINCISPAVWKNHSKPLKEAKPCLKIPRDANQTHNEVPFLSEIQSRGWL